MTNHRALTFSFLTVAIVLTMAAPAAAQETECQPDDLFCAELRIGPGRGTLRVGPGDAPPPPQPEPEPPMVIVQPAPPPPQPQPPTVIVQPAPPPPPPQVVQVQPAPPQTYVVRRERPRGRFPYSAIGPHFAISGVFGDELAMGGGRAGLRIRPNPWFALDINGGFFWGSDYNGLDRTEIPLTVDALLFFNPQHRFQFYALLGVGASLAHAEGTNRFTLRNVDRDYVHLGGELGLGVEWRISRVFALNFDVRGFLRQRVDDNAEPEFTEPGESGRWQATDTSGGVVGQLGMTFYFGR